MKIFVAGATGALGSRLVPRLVERGHEVTGMTRSAAKAELVRGLGAEPAIADALDPEAVAAAIASAEPEVVVHELTALSGDFDMRKPETTFAVTNRLRTEGTDHLLSAARAVGAKRFVAQSFGGWPHAREGGPAKTEDVPLDPNPPESLRSMQLAIRHLEEAVTGAAWVDGIVLRYGGFYGPGTSFGRNPDGEQIEMLRARKFPLIGKAGGVWSFIHIDDAAEATVAAIERGAPGIYNIADDEPAAVAEWLPAAAEAIGAKPPHRVPRWLGRLLAGEAATIMMTEVRGVSNAKAKRELGWEPRYSSWRRGFVDGLG